MSHADEVADRLTGFGCAVVSGFFAPADLAPARAAVRAFVALRTRWAGLPEPPGEPDEFDAGFLRLCRHGAVSPNPFARSVALAVAIQALGTHPELVRLTHELTGTDLLSFTAPNVLIGTPDDPGGAAPAHADSPLAGADAGLTYLIPLRDVPAECAPRVARSAGAEVLICPLRVGDVLVLARRSWWHLPTNASAHTRWLIEGRYGNCEHPAAVAAGWPIGRTVPRSE